MCKHGDQSGSSDGINGWYRNIYYTLTIYPAKQATATEPRATQFFLISFRQHTQIKAVYDVWLPQFVIFQRGERAGFFLPQKALDTHAWTIPIRHRKKLQCKVEYLWSSATVVEEWSISLKTTKQGLQLKMCLPDVVQIWTKHGSLKR